jgi:hypothetical protein
MPKDYELQDIARVKMKILNTQDIVYIIILNGKLLFGTWGRVRASQIGSIRWPKRCAASSTSH